MKRQPYYTADTHSYADLHPVMRRRYEEAVEKEYLVYRSSESRHPIRIAFWDWCIRYARPQVAVKTTPKKAIVEMDLISVDRQRPPHLIDRESKGFRFFCWDLQQTIEKFLPDYYQRRPNNLPGYFTYVENVPLDQAEGLAKAMLSIYAKHFDKYQH